LCAAALAAFFKSPFLALTVLAMAALVPLLLSRADKPETVMVLLLLFTAFLLSFGADVLHINDTFQPPLDRMNTVFKFYYQIWFLLGVGAVYGIFWAFKYSLKHPNLRAAWLAPMALLVMGAMVYPYASVLVKTNHFANVPTLDGSFYLNNSYPADRAGIEWLRAHVQGTPVVLEATGAEYTDFARVSTFTGLPTVLGWAGHELQWRGNYDEPGKRIPDIDTLYTSPDLSQVKTLLDRYAIDYVFVGTLERQKYPEPGLQKFSALLEKVYENPGGVVIYRRR
jgi:YYY domain-containing protein